MRPWPVAIAASLAAHAALALVVPVRRVAPPIAGPREPPAAPDPIEVTVATLDAPVAVGDRGAGAGAAQATHTAIATTVRRGGETPVPPGTGTSAGWGGETPVPPGTGTPAGRAMMAMRRGAPPAPLAPLSARFIDDLLLHTRPRELLPDERIAEDIQQARHDRDWARLQASLKNADDHCRRRSPRIPSPTSAEQSLPMRSRRGRTMSCGSPIRRRWSTSDSRPGC